MLRLAPVLFALASLFGPFAGAASGVRDVAETRSAAEAFETEARFLVPRVTIAICQELEGYCLDVQTESTVDVKIIRGLFGERFLGMPIHLQGDRAPWKLRELRVLQERLSEIYLGIDPAVVGLGVDESQKKVRIFVVDQKARATLGDEFGALPVVLEVSGRFTTF